MFTSMKYRHRQQYQHQHQSFLRLLFLSFLFFLVFLIDVSGAAGSSSPTTTTMTTTVTIHAWPLDEASSVPLAVVEYKFDATSNNKVNHNDDDDVSVGVGGAGTATATAIAPATGNTNATLLSYTPPKLPSSSSSSSSFFSSSKKKNKEKNNNDGKKGSDESRPLDLVRVGLYEGSERQWTGVVVGRSALAGAISDNNDGIDDDKEVKTTLVLHVDADGVLYGVGVGAEKVKKRRKGRRVGGGGDKDGKEDKPNVVVEVSRQTLGPRPHMNKPVVLSPDGKKVGESQEPEKTFLQK